MWLMGIEPLEEQPVLLIAEPSFQPHKPGSLNLGQVSAGTRIWGPQQLASSGTNSGFLDPGRKR